MERKIKKARYSDEPIYVDVNGNMESYVPKEIITNRDAYGASLHLLFKHVADFHLLMIEIISEKTGIDSNEIINVVKDDPRYKEMMVSPTINSLSILKKEDVEKHVPVETAIDTITEKLEQIAIEPVKKKKIVVRKKASE
jgi:hypothetical protein